jgi:hypothetical protein
MSQSVRLPLLRWQNTSICFALTDRLQQDELLLPHVGVGEDGMV